MEFNFVKGYIIYDKDFPRVHGKKGWEPLAYSQRNAEQNQALAQMLCSRQLQTMKKVSIKNGEKATHLNCHNNLQNPFIFCAPLEKLSTVFVDRNGQSMLKLYYITTISITMHN